MTASLDQSEMMFIKVVKQGSRRQLLLVVLGVVVALAATVAAMINFVDSSLPLTQETPWRLEEIRNGGRELVLQVEHYPGCEPHQDVAVTESPDKVHVTATRADRLSLEMCPDKPSTRPVSVELESRLGERTLTGCDDSRASDPVIARQPPPNGYCAELPRPN